MSQHQDQRRGDDGAADADADQQEPRPRPRTASRRAIRVAEASDNAAYWSIATTMRSDNKALSTVQDALGLGAATVDIAYTGMNNAIERRQRDQEPSWLPPAQPGVDRAKIQTRNHGAAGAAEAASPSSATFSGENWLSVDSSAAGYQRDQEHRLLVHAAPAARSRCRPSPSTRRGDGPVRRERCDDQRRAGILDGNRDARPASSTMRPARSRSRRSNISALTDSTADLAILDSYIKRRRRGHHGDDRRGDQPRRRQDAHRASSRTSSRA